MFCLARVLKKEDFFASPCFYFTRFVFLPIVETFLSLRTLPLFSAIVPVVLCALFFPTCFLLLCSDHCFFFFNIFLSPSEEKMKQNTLFKPQPTKYRDFSKSFAFSFLLWFWYCVWGKVFFLFSNLHCSVCCCCCFFAFLIDLP